MGRERRYKKGRGEKGENEGKRRKVDSGVYESSCAVKRLLGHNSRKGNN